MSKRFRDTGMWDKDWYVGLSCAERCAVDYIFCRCDPVGVWAPSFNTAGKMIGEKVDWKELPSKVNGNLVVLDDGKWWMKDFCAYQYGKINAESESKVQQSLHSLLVKHGLWDAYLTTVKPRVRPTVSDTVQDKDKVKEKEKVKVREEGAVLSTSQPELSASIEAAFLSKNGERFTNWGRERLAIKGIIEKAKARHPEDPGALIGSMISAFWKLKQEDRTARGYWRIKAFLPSQLNCDSVWDSVLETMRSETLDPEVAAIINGGAT